MNPSLAHFEDKVAIVTGASSGIGEAIAIALVTRGLRVVGLARRKEKLDELSNRLENANGKFIPLQTDISKEEDIESAFQWIKENVGPVHVLINNAAVLRPKGLVDGDPNSWREIFNTNVLGLCIATKEAIADMKANDINGHIIHINSIAGHIVPAYPNLNAYPASKWAVTALTETLRQELNFIGSKIKVTSVSPGAVQTEMLAEAVARLPGENKKVFESFPILNSDDIADSVVYVLSTPPHVQVHELIIKPVGEIV